MTQRTIAAADKNAPPITKQLRNKGYTAQQTRQILSLVSRLRKATSEAEKTKTARQAASLRLAKPVLQLYRLAERKLASSQKLSDLPPEDTQKALQAGSFRQPSAKSLSDDEFLALVGKIRSSYMMGTLGGMPGPEKLPRTKRSQKGPLRLIGLMCEGYETLDRSDPAQVKKFREYFERRLGRFLDSYYQVHSREVKKLAARPSKI